MRPVAILVLILVPTLAQAQIESRPLKVEGVDGIWFSMPKAKKLLKDVKRLPKIQLELSKVQGRLDLEKDYTDLLKADVKDTEQISSLWKDMAVAQAKLLVRKQADPWWRNPYLWTTVGFALGVGAAVGIAVAIDRTGVVR